MIFTKNHPEVGDRVKFNHWDTGIEYTGTVIMAEFLPETGNLCVCIDTRMKMSYNKQERDTMQTKTDPYNLTAQELEIIHGAGWKETPYTDFPVKFYHPSVKGTDGRYKRLNGAEVLDIIKKNMQDTLREGLDY